MYSELRNAQKSKRKIDDANQYEKKNTININKKITTEIRQPRGYGMEMVLEKHAADEVSQSEWTPNNSKLPKFCLTPLKTRSLVSLFDLC